MENGNEKIKLVLINERAMTFNASDYLKLRSEHRIVGKLIGVSAPYPTKMKLPHLPACYNEYETKLMLEENIAVLEDKCELEKPPTEMMKKDYDEHNKQAFDEIQISHVENRLQAVKSKMEQILIGKRKKLLKSGIVESEINLSEEDILKEEENKMKQSINPNTLLTHISTEHPFNLNPKIITEFTVKNLVAYKVFKDLWHKGYYLTNALNFGGDFLAYVGDPMFYHASKIIHVADINELFDPIQLASFARLSVTVKKKCVYAYLNDEGTVSYQTVEWDNPKLKQLYTLKKIKTNVNNDDKVEEVDDENIEMEDEEESGGDEDDDVEMEINDEASNIT